MSLKNKKGGFTLIELLVVIAIIGILASVVLTSLNTGRKKSRDARRQSDIRQIALAMEIYYDDGETYLPSTTMPGVIGAYLPAVPKDPGTGSPIYGWFDNTGGLEYCTWAVYEQPPTGLLVIAASEKGVQELAAAPAALTCW